MSLKYATIIPFYNHWELCHRRLMEYSSHRMLQNHQDSFIVLVDDYSTDRSSDGGINWWQNEIFHDRLKFFRNKENKGFGGSMNTGAKIAIKNGAEALVFLSNDVTIFDDYLRDVDAILSVNDNVLIGREMLCNDTGWNVLDNCGVIPYVNGWFLSCTVPVWLRLGGFDPGYGKFDYEDVDLSTQAWMKDVKLTTVGTKLHHASGQTINNLPGSRLQHTLDNQVYWKHKWAEHALTLKGKIYGTTG